MSTQSRSLYTKSQLRTMAEEAGIEVPPEPSPISKIGEQMEAAIEEVTGMVETARDAIQVPETLRPFILGFLFGFSTLLLALVLAKVL